LFKNKQEPMLEAVEVPHPHALYGRREIAAHTHMVGINIIEPDISKWRVGQIWPITNCAA